MFPARDIGGDRHFEQSRKSASTASSGMRMKDRAANMDPVIYNFDNFNFDNFN